MAKYVMQEMPDVRGTGERVKYPRLVVEGQIDLRRLSEEVASRSSLSRGEVEATISMLSDLMTEYMGRGYSVRLDGLGLFTAKLGLREGAQRETLGGTKRNAMSIEVCDIHFRADKDLVKRADRACDLERSKAQSYVNPRKGSSERLVDVLAFLSKKHSIGVGEYASLTGLSRSSAQRELRAWATEGLLGIEGLGTHRRYTRPVSDASGRS